MSFESVAICIEVSDRDFALSDKWHDSMHHGPVLTWRRVPRF